MTLHIASTDDLATCHALRRDVFVGEQKITEAEEFDNLDGAAVHLLAVRDGAPVGTARVFSGEDGRIGRICVLKAARGTGLGAALVEAGIAQLKAEGSRRVMLDAQVYALPFYEKLGFVAYGPEFDDAGIPHQRMSRAL